MSFGKKGLKDPKLSVERLLDIADVTYNILLVSSKPGGFSWQDELDFRTEAKATHKRIHHLRKMVAIKPESRHTERKYRRAAVRFIKDYRPAPRRAR